MTETGAIEVIHARIRAIATEYGVSTDQVMLAVGLALSDLSVTCDPRLPERLKALSELFPDGDAFEPLLKAVRVLLRDVAAMGV